MFTWFKGYRDGVNVTVDIRGIFHWCYFNQDSDWLFEHRFALKISEYKTSEWMRDKKIELLRKNQQHARKMDARKMDK